MFYIYHIIVVKIMYSNRIFNMFSDNFHPISIIIIVSMIILIRIIIIINTQWAGMYAYAIMSTFINQKQNRQFYQLSKLSKYI